MRSWRGKQAWLGLYKQLLSGWPYPRSSIGRLSFCHAARPGLIAINVAKSLATHPYLTRPCILARSLAQALLYLLSHKSVPGVLGIISGARHSGKHQFNQGCDQQQRFHEYPIYERVLERGGYLLKVTQLVTSKPVELQIHPPSIMLATMTSHPENLKGQCLCVIGRSSTEEPQDCSRSMWLGGLFNESLTLMAAGIVSEMGM